MIRESIKRLAPDAICLAMFAGLFTASLSTAFAQSVDASATQSKCRATEYAEQAAALNAIEGPIGLLRIAREAYERPLLLDPEFIANSTIAKIFGIARIKDLTWEKYPTLLAKEIESEFNSSLQAEIYVGYSTYDDENPPRHSGWFSIKPHPGSTIYTAQMIERYLVFDIKGFDVLQNQALNYPDIHARESYSRRDEPTHPNGYFWYQATQETRCYRSRIFVRLQGDGTLFDISINVDEKKWNIEDLLRTN